MTNPEDVAKEIQKEVFDRQGYLIVNFEEFRDVIAKSLQQARNEAIEEAYRMALETNLNVHPACGLSVAKLIKTLKGIMSECKSFTEHYSYHHRVA